MAMPASSTSLDRTRTLQNNVIQIARQRDILREQYEGCREQLVIACQKLKLSNRYGINGIL